MHSLRVDLAQKKKKQAMRRLSQSGSSSRRLTTPTGKPASKSLRGGKGVVAGVKGQQKQNPFLQVVSSSTTTVSQGSLATSIVSNSSTTDTATSADANPVTTEPSSKNPFFAAIGKQEAPAQSLSSYASVVSGKQTAAAEAGNASSQPAKDAKKPARSNPFLVNQSSFPSHKHKRPSQEAAARAGKMKAAISSFKPASHSSGQRRYGAGATQEPEGEEPEQLSPQDLQQQRQLLQQPQQQLLQEQFQHNLSHHPQAQLHQMLQQPQFQQQLLQNSQQIQWEQQQFQQQQLQQKHQQQHQQQHSEQQQLYQQQHLEQQHLEQLQQHQQLQQQQQLVQLKRQQLVEQLHQKQRLKQQQYLQQKMQQQPQMQKLQHPSQWLQRQQLEQLPSQQLQHQQQQQRPQQQLQQQQQPSKGKKSSVFGRLGPMASQSPKKRPKLPVYDKEDWMPGKEGSEEEEDDGAVENKSHKVSQSVLKDLGNKYSGDEMDLIAKTATHGYYLRSLEHTQYYPNKGSSPSQDVLTVCPYDIPKPHLPAPPTPKGSTAADYYDALDSRDQEIRKGMKKQTSLIEAQVIVGTCPDMCPEKERYRRQDTHRLSWFEARRDGESRHPKVDHALAVKEYSGSAADKEEPLPHDLRPLGVLQMTMDYLVTAVMDSGANRPYDWYDFLWNRTRGIRKDITIQHLCCPESVELTEKCARFHVLCSHHLCEEEITTFDPKLNNENLNKCLLSLKQLYRDLRLEQGILCPNEAEFCCFEILLHLSDGDVLNVVQEYSPAVREASLVTFAVAVALAFETNNFVKFFKFLRSATFLNACLLHRYLPVVQTRALRVLNRSHSMQKRSTPFPLQHLTRMLAFKDQSQTVAFCEQFDLEITASDVKFDRPKTATITLEEQSLPLRKSEHLVLSKNTKSLGEVVHGGPLPPRYHHTPYSSFTAEGLSAISTEAVDAPSDVPSRPPSPSYSQQDLSMVLHELMEEEIIAICAELTEQCLAEAEEAALTLALTQVVEEVSRDCMEEVVAKMTAEMSVQVVEEAVGEALFMESLLDSVCRENVNSLTQTTAGELVGEICRECIIEVEAEQKVVLEVCMELVEQGVCEEIQLCAMEALLQAKQLKTAQLDSLRQSFMLMQLRKSWTRWLQILQVKQHAKLCAGAVPPLPPLLSLPEQMNRLLPWNRQQHLVNGGLKRVPDQLAVTANGLQKKRKEFYSPFGLPSLLQNHLVASRTADHASSSLPDVYWKLLLLHRHPQELSDVDRNALKWIKCKLHLSPDTVAPSEEEPVWISSTPLSFNSLHGADPADRSLALCVRGMISAAQGVNLEQRKRAVQGVCALILFVSAPQDLTTPPQTYLLSMLEGLLDCRPNSGDTSKMPLLVMYSSDLEDRHLAFWYRSRIALQNYCQQLVSVSQIFWMKLDMTAFASISFSDSVATEFSQNLQRLAMASPSQPALSHTPLREYVEQGLQRHFFPLVISDSRNREKASLPSQPFLPLVTLYNATIVHLIAQAQEPAHLQWPIPEFATHCKFSKGSLPPLHWNSEAYLGSVVAALSRLMLPSASCQSEGEWSQQCARCMEFVYSLEIGNKQSVIPLCSSVKCMILNAKSIPWDQVILACVEYMVAMIESELWVSTLVGSHDNLVVPVEWLRAEADTSLSSVAHMCSPVVPHIRRHKRHLSDPSYLDAAPSRPLPLRQSITVGVSPSQNLLEVEEWKRQKLALSREKELSEEFEAQLQQWVRSDAPAQELPASSGGVATATPLDEPNGVQDQVKQLSKRIKTLRWQDAMDSVWLHSLTNDYPLD